MSLSSTPPAQLALYAVLLALPLAAFAARRLSTPTAAQPIASTKEEEPKSIMQPARDDLAPPLDTPYTRAELSAFDGSDPSKPIYVAIKGTIFDVSRKADVYGPGKGYNVFAGKDGSQGLGMSSLKPEHAVPDYSGLDPKDRKTLDDWFDFFSKRYNVVGKVSDIPSAEQPAANL